MGGIFLQKNSLITYILCELWLIMIFRPVANFAQQPLQKDFFAIIEIIYTICHSKRFYANFLKVLIFRDYVSIKKNTYIHVFATARF
jgi:hypothetical protein